MRRAFTLIELLVVMAIIGLLVAISLPAMAASRQTAGAMVCMTRLKQVMAASINYSVQAKDYMPFANSDSMENASVRTPIWSGPGWLYQWPNKSSTEDLKAGLLWQYLNNKDMYRCPADVNHGQWHEVGLMTSYTMNNAMHGPFKLIPNGRAFQYRSDAIIFWEINDQDIIGGGGNYNDGNNVPTQLITGRHKGGGNYAAIDGSVRHIQVLDFARLSSEGDPIPGQPHPLGPLWCSPVPGDVVPVD